MAKRIPGTRVPDTAIHRASMWLEDLKFGERRAYTSQPESKEADFEEKFVEATGVRSFTADEMREAAVYYGQNLRRMVLGDRLNIAMPSPTGEGLIDADGIFISLWLDAFEHGIATGLGLRGLSNDEIAAN